MSAWSVSNQGFQTLRLLIGLTCLAMLVVPVTGCQPEDSAASTANAAEPAKPPPRFPDGRVQFDRVPGEKGYWDSPSASALVEASVQVDMDAAGRLKNIADAARVAPFQPW